MPIMISIMLPFDILADGSEIAIGKLIATL